MVFYCNIIEEDGGYTAEFPDLPNIITYGNTKDEAVFNAAEALNGALESDVARGLLPPDPSYLEGIPVEVEPHIEIAIQLRSIRGSITQSEIASRLGVPYQSYQRLENPIKGNPSVKTLEKIARVLGKRLEIRLI